MSDTPYRILGIDPGLRVTGFGVIERRGKSLSYVASGVIKIPSQDLPSRLKTILDNLAEVIHTYAPQQAVVEKVFVNVNPQSTLLLGQARGAAICALVSANVPVAEYTALQVKQSVVGYGKASKEQVQQMVMRLLALSAPPSRDAADALACAVCHAHAGSLMGALGGLSPALAKRGLRIRGGRLV